MSFDFFYYLYLWRPFCLAEPDHLSNFHRGSCKEQFLRFLLNIGSLAFFPSSSGSHLVYRCKMILAVLIGSHQGIIPVMFESNLPKGLVGVCILSKVFTFFLFLALVTIFSSERNRLNHFGRESPEQHFCGVQKKLVQGKGFFFIF